MKEDPTVWEYLKDDWIIKKSAIKDLGINPNKKWDDVTIHELDLITTLLDVRSRDVLKF